MVCMALVIRIRVLLVKKHMIRLNKLSQKLEDKYMLDPRVPNSVPERDEERNQTTRPEDFEPVEAYKTYEEE